MENLSLSTLNFIYRNFVHFLTNLSLDSAPGYNAVNPQRFSDSTRKLGPAQQLVSLGANAGTFYAVGRDTIAILNAPITLNIENFFDANVNNLPTFVDVTDSKTTALRNTNSVNLIMPLVNPNQGTELGQPRAAPYTAPSPITQLATNANGDIIFIQSTTEIALCGIAISAVFVSPFPFVTRSSEGRLSKPVVLKNSIALFQNASGGSLFLYGAFSSPSQCKI
jgi:hypothetical protein